MLTEKMQREVTIREIDGNNVFEVQVFTQILKDGVEISRTTPHRCAYTHEDKDLFLSEIEDADKWIEALRW
jgi:hypothetical protein